jgi:phage shock protein C
MGVTDRLYRSPTDRVIAGVAGGLAVWLNVDASLVRLAWVLLAIFSGGIFVLVYIVLMIVVPLPPPGWVPQPRGTVGGWQAGGPGAIPGWQPGGDPPAGTGPPPTPGSSGWGAPQPGSSSSWSAPQQPWTPGPRAGQNAGIVAGAILIVLGVWFLIAPYIRIDWQLVWPLVVILLGGALIAGAMRRNRPPDG